MSFYKAAQSTPWQTIVGSEDVNTHLEDAMLATKALIKNKLDVIMNVGEDRTPHPVWPVYISQDDSTGKYLE